MPSVGYVERIARLKAYNVNTLSYDYLLVDPATGALQTTGTGGGAGGSVTQGTVPWVVSGAAGAVLALDATVAAVLTQSDFDTKVGSLTEAAPASDTASSGQNGRLQRIAQRLTSIIALLPAALGAGGGLKVDGSGTALPISGSVTANIGTSGSLALDATVATLLTLSDFDTKTGSLTEAAPASDTASSGVNGRLQRIAQRLTSIIALLPTALGTGGGLKVDGSGTALPVSGTVTANIGTSGSLALDATVATPATLLNGKTTVTVAGTRVTLAASTASKSITVKALTTNTGTIFVGNSTVSSANGLQLAAGDSVSFDLANLNTVNIDSSVSGEGVSYLAVAA